MPQYLRSNVDGSLALLATAREAGVGAAWCCRAAPSSALGRSRGGSATRIAVRPDTHYGAAKAALEAFVQKWGLGEGWPVAALRPTGVYGMVVPVERSKWFDLVARCSTA